jgi:membrane protein implicated in regulation of membrane protease activity
MSRDDPDLGPVRSALTLRLWLAGFGLLFCGVAAAVVAAVGLLWLAVLFVVLAVVAVADLRVVARRKRRGEPG